MPGGTACLDLDPGSCASAGGTPAGAGTTCAMRPCPLAEIACCAADGSCQDLDRQSCAGSRGSAQDAGSRCATSACPVTVGACCVDTPFGTTCETVGAAQCTADRGTFAGTGTNCARVACGSTQACCLRDGTCADATGEGCLRMGGLALGVGSSCAATPCGGGPAMPGETPDGTTRRPGAPLRVRKSPSASGDLVLDWSPSCSPSAVDATVHEGRIGAWYSHDVRLCGTAGALVTATLTPGPAGTYYLIVPVTAAAEGSYGIDSRGSERPRSGTTCAPAQVLGCP